MLFSFLLNNVSLTLLVSLPFSGSLCVSLIPFMLHPNLSPGGDDGSLSEKTPNKQQTRCMMLYGQTGKHKRAKNNSNELKERLSKVCFQNSPAESSDASPPSQSLPPSNSLHPHSQHHPLSPPFSLPFSFSPLSILFSLPITPETKWLKRKERRPFLLIS